MLPEAPLTMNDLTELLGKLNIPPEQLTRISEEAKSNPMAAIGLLNEYVSPELLQQLIAAFLSNPDAIGQMAEQAGVSPEQLAGFRQQFGADQEG